MLDTGSLITTFYSLLEIAFKIERLYEIVEIDGGSDSSSYYRAGGSNVGSMQMQMVNRRPPVMSVYGAPSAPVQVRLLFQKGTKFPELEKIRF